MPRISSDIGWRRPLHYGMLGMVLMAYLAPSEARRIIQQFPLEGHTPFSITDDDAFNLRLGQIRERGYVLEREEAVEGVMGIAAPVRDYARQVVAALGIALPMGQPSLNVELDQTIDLVKKACEDISSDLGYLKI
jgi:DNA-binding IclR family transcriptional regulator